MIHHLPDHINCKITNEGKPLADLMIICTLGTINKNSHSIIFGPTNENGLSTIQKDDILTQAEDQMNLALMDYFSLENNFNGKIFLSVMGKDQIEKALYAYQVYKKVAKYPSDYKNHLEKSLKKITGLTNFNPKIKFTISPPNIHISIHK